MRRLIVTEGPDQGRVFVLSTLPVTLGRGYEARIRLADGAISRVHAHIEAGEDGALTLVDLGSTNGTKVNGRREQSCALADGDVIAFGHTVLRVEGVRRPGTDAFAPELSIPVESDERTMIDAFAPAEGDHDAAHRGLLALYRADALLNASTGDLAAGLDQLLPLLCDTFEADRATVLLLNAGSGELTRAAQLDRTGAAPGADVQVSRTLLARVADTRQSMLSYDAVADARLDEAASLVTNRVRSLMCAPLVRQEKVFGVLYLDTEQSERRFTPEDLRLFTALAGRTALVVANAQLNQELRGLFFNTLEAMVDAIQMKDPYTRGHSERVRRYSLLLAREMDLPAEVRRKLQISAVLHDVGKIGMPDRLLFNTDELTPEERIEVQEHPSTGARFLEKIPPLHDAIDGVKYHHENYDGSGYPDGLAGEDIPLQGRIVAVADTFDACTTNRPYQKGVSRPEAIKILRRLKGGRLDPAMVDLFEQALLKEGLLKEPVPQEG
ncbi:MAG: HD domain-containing phosphohydrolase [Planctomycetota bacterium]|jgi:HD-GYP domain-containing protein (c-di-GMP phosphodiesterase class II)